MSFSIPYQTKNEQKPEKNLKVSARKLLYILFAHTTLFHKYTSVFGFAVRKWGSGKMSIHKKIAKSLKSGLKSVFFAVMSVTFSHQYHTLHMARKGKKSVISHFYSARSRKHIDPLILLHHFKVMISGS